MNDGKPGPVLVGDYVSVHYTAIPSGREVVFDGRVIDTREPHVSHSAVTGTPNRCMAMVSGQRTIQVEPFIPVYKTQWWHRWQVESYRIEGAGPS